MKYPTIIKKKTIKKPQNPQKKPTPKSKFKNPQKKVKVKYSILKQFII